MSERAQLASRSASTSGDGVSCASMAVLSPNSDHPFRGVICQLVPINLLGVGRAPGVEQGRPQPVAGREGQRLRLIVGQLVLERDGPFKRGDGGVHVTCVPMKLTLQDTADDTQ